MNINAGAIIDGIAGILLIVFLYRGMMRGFSGEVIGLVGFFVGTFCSYRFTNAAVVVANKWLGNNSIDPNVLAIMCSVGIFFVVELVFVVVGVILSYLVKVTKLSFTDHFFGMLIGLLKTAFIVLVVYAVLASLPGLMPQDWVEQSYTLKGAAYVWPYVRDFLEAHGLLDLSTLTGA